MKIKKLGLSLAVATALGFSGCGSSGSSSTSSDDTKDGTFVDAPVKGLYYKTATQSGYTNTSGIFKYKAGEIVEFKLGTLSLGTVTAGSLITPYTIAGDTNTSNPSAKATNIAMLLQSFDGNRSNTASLDLSKLKDYNLSDINLTDTIANMNTKLHNMLITGSFANDYADGNTTEINATTANSVMQTFVEQEQNSRTISVANGFGAKWLDSRTLWTISDNTIYEFKFENGKQTIKGMVYNQSYTTPNGIITVDEAGIDNEHGGVYPADSYQYYRILATDGTKITTTDDMDFNLISNQVLGDGNDTQVFFTNEADAKIFLNAH